MACENCEITAKENENISVPYVVHEGAMARSERQIKRLWIAIIVAVSLIFASNALWLWAWMQYDYTSTTEEYIYTQDGEGTNIIGNSNEVNNGADANHSTQDTHPNEEK